MVFSILIQFLKEEGKPNNYNRRKKVQYRGSSFKSPIKYTQHFLKNTK